jgi:hypothetical protein
MLVRMVVNASSSVFTRIMEAGALLVNPWSLQHKMDIAYADQPVGDPLGRLGSFIHPITLRSTLQVTIGFAP